MKQWVDLLHNRPSLTEGAKPPRFARQPGPRLNGYSSDVGEFYLY